MKQNKSFLLLGLTGGAGSGKTTVVELIKEQLPTEFLHCDVIAHELMEPGGASYQVLLQEFGTGILEEGSERISRPKLSAAAMATKERRERLNELTHPLVTKELLRRVEALRESSFCGVVIIEAALLIEAGIDRLCDTVWYVYAPVAQRAARMKQNRGYSDEKIANILAGQLTAEEFLEHSDVVIRNPDVDKEKQRELLLQQIRIHLKEQLESIQKV